MGFSPRFPEIHASAWAKAHPTTSFVGDVRVIFIRVKRERSRRTLFTRIKITRTRKQDCLRVVDERPLGMKLCGTTRALLWADLEMPRWGGDHHPNNPVGSAIFKMEAKW